MQITSLLCRYFPRDFKRNLDITNYPPMRNLISTLGQELILILAIRNQAPKPNQ